MTLNDGNKIPLLGFGTASDRKKVKQAVAAAIETGYRHIDTASVYNTEVEVGEAIKESGMPREDVFLTTKLHNTDHARVAEALKESMQRLQTNYVDLYLIHWPCSVDPEDNSKVLPHWDYVKTWQEMQKLSATGKVKSIFGPKHRLWAFTICLIVLPASLILWGVGAAHQIHWFGLIVAMCGTAFCNCCGITPSVNFLVDSYPAVSGDGMTTVVIIRNTMSFDHPLAEWSRHAELLHQCCVRREDSGLCCVPGHDMEGEDVEVEVEGGVLEKKHVSMGMVH